MKRSRRDVAASVAGLLVCLYLVVFEIVWATGQIAAGRRLDAHGVAAHAVVTSVKTHSTGDRTPSGSTVHVVFTDAQGHRSHGKYLAPEDGGGAAPHMEIPIRYDPQDPAVVKPVGLRFTPRVEDGIWFLGTVGLPAAWIAGLLLVRIRRHLRPAAVASRPSGKRPPATRPGAAREAGSPPVVAAAGTTPGPIEAGRGPGVASTSGPGSGSIEPVT